MIGKQILKPVQNWLDYTQAALWCNANKAMIEDKGDINGIVTSPEKILEKCAGMFHRHKENSRYQ